MNLCAIRSNVQAIKNHIGENVHLMAVLKANACGHGMIELARISIEAGATWLGVATLDEALVLRVKLRDPIPILVFGYVEPNDLSVVTRYNITVTAISLEWLQSAVKVATCPFNFHLKIDTGLNRIGCRTPEDVESISKIVSTNCNLNWTGVYTHFATAEHPENQEYMRKQLQIFEQFIKVIPNRKQKIIHCANSCATLFYPSFPYYDLVRVGRGLMGPPVEELKHYQHFPLQSSISLHSILVLVKQLEAGEYVGYDCDYKATEQQWIGTVPIGYADGWHQHYRTNDVLVGGIRVPIVGRISMDQMTIALPKSYPVGTQVTLIGQQGDESILGEEIATRVKVPRSQLFAALSVRIPRLYFENNRLISIENSLLNQIHQL